MHLITSASLLILGLWLELEWIYFVGWGIASALLIYEHLALSPTDMSRLRFVFSWVNAGISLALLTFTYLAVVVM
jgi:4-hydroxybenzoate polyprenyltransferase